MIRVITNSLGSGDWTVIKNGSETLFEGHKPSAFDLVSIFEQMGYDSKVVECTDEQIEEGEY